MGQLNAAFCRSVRHRGGTRKYADHHYDRHGLYLQVLRSGKKQWVQRLVLDGTRHDYGLGGYEFLTLGQAREQAFENAKAARAYRRARARGEQSEVPAFEMNRRATVARRNGQPVPQAGMLTFEQAFEACIQERCARWKNPEVDLRSWRADLKHHLACLAAKPVAAVTVQDLDACLSRLTPAGQDKLLRRCGTVFAWAEARDLLANGNPARKLRNSWTGLKREAPEHRKALPWREVPDFYARLTAGGTGADARGALALLILTGLRSAETRGAMWEELDLEARLWTIPAGPRMKEGREHRIPISSAACAVLRAAGPKGMGRVFHSPRGHQVTDKALRRILADLGADATVHGFRSSLRDWCAECGVAREVAEACLAHRVGSSVEQAYARSDMLERRRKAVYLPWAAWVTGAGG